MFAKLKNFIVVCILCKDSLSDFDRRILEGRIAVSKPHYWEEYEPGIFLAFFLVKRGGATKSIKLTAGAGTLRKPNTPFSEMGTGKTVGELVTETNWYGKILTCPFGDAVNKALARARDDAEKGGSSRRTPAGEPEE